MAQRRHHYERAFETYVRERQIPYVSVDEARRAIVPDGAPLRVRYGPASASSAFTQSPPSHPGPLKSFDFVLYGQDRHALIDVKGRKVMARSPVRGGAELRVGRLESWVTHDDVTSLSAWRELFGADFDAAFVFVYWCDVQPSKALFQEIFEYNGRWYALRAIGLDDYAGAMKTRSVKWQTVDLAGPAFERLSEPFASGWAKVQRRPVPAMASTQPG